MTNGVMRRGAGKAVGLALVAGLAIFHTFGPAAAAEQCLVVQHYYFPVEGKEAEVLATRIKGNEVRAALGLATSRLLVVKSSASGHPAKGAMGPGHASYLMSQSEFENLAAKKQADEALAGSPEYLAVRRQMAQLLDHFEMAVRTSVGGGCARGNP